MLKILTTFIVILRQKVCFIDNDVKKFLNNKSSQSIDKKKQKNIERGKLFFKVPLFGYHSFLRNLN